MAALTAIAVGAAVAGGALQMYGQAQATAKQAKAEEENAKYLEEQAAFTREAERRTLNTFDQEAEQFRGSQISGYSAGGVSLTGSPLAILADTIGRQMQDRSAIQLDYQAKEREALLKAGASYRQANDLRGWKSKYLPGAAIGLQTAGQVASIQSNNSKNSSAKSSGGGTK